ncbi:MAG: iron-containing alcohol dehydrogenase [Victivallaceae bacterium]|nr:iron-containing alcohol dehydrogenase [Victivallaceae bacterium]
MAKFEFSLPEKIRFGRGSRFDLASLLPPGAVLVLCGHHSEAAIRRESDRLFPGRAVEIFSEIPAEIPLAAVESARICGRRIQARSIIGWGGGSAIDAAKATAALLDEEYPVADYFYGRRTASPRRVFFAALPTTAGTGAEVTANAVLHDESTRVKQSLRTPDMAADAAIVDPDLAAAPFAVMAASGMDALTQAIESFVSRNADDATRFLAATAAKTLFLHLENACRGDAASVEEICRASLTVGIAFGKSGLGAVHGLAHPLGCVKHLPHGFVCAVLLEKIVRANAARAPQIYRELDRALGFSAVEKIGALRAALDLPPAFDFTLTPREIDFIVAHSRSGSMKCNPVFYTDAELAALLRV